jgi:hypothetical protein
VPWASGQAAAAFRRAEAWRGAHLARELARPTS